MKRLFMTMLVGLCLLCGGESVCQAAGRVVTDSVQSKVLGKTIHYNVYLPQGFKAGTQKRYPVLYLLHGLYGTHVNWTERGQANVVADLLISSGEVRPLIIIMPEAGARDLEAFQNGYFNMPEWPYEDFFFQEFMPEVEGKYAVQSDKAHRAISGLSMGGLGSFGYAQRHPDLFCACYAMSAWMDTPEPQRDRVKGEKAYRTYRCTYENKPIDYIKKVSDDQKNQWKTVKWFLDCGDDDHLLYCNVELFAAMRKLHTPIEMRVRNGAHTWEYWHTALYTALPFVSRNFDK